MVCFEKLTVKKKIFSQIENTMRAKYGKNGITKGSSCDFVFRALHGRWEMWAGGQEHFNLNAVYVDKAMTA